MSSGLLSLKWNNHRSTFFHVLSSIRSKESYCDATLACDGRFYPVHKLILSTCSEYFEQIFERTQCKHPVIVLKDIKHDDLEALMNYMYVGEVNVLQEKLAGLIKAAECLKIKGLAVPDEDPLVSNKKSQLQEDVESPRAKRRRREGSVNYEERERHGANRNVRSNPRDHPSHLTQTENCGESSQIEHTNASESKIVDNHSMSLDGGPEPSDSDQSSHRLKRRSNTEPSSHRLPTPKPIHEISVDETSVKAEPPDIQEEVEDSKEMLHSNLGYDPLAESDSINADPSSVASGSNEAHFPESNMLESTPQSVEDVVAQALPPTSSSFQGNSFSMWEGEGSLQNFPSESFTNENSQGRPMVEVPLTRCDGSKDGDGEDIKGPLRGVPPPLSSSSLSNHPDSTASDSFLRPCLSSPPLLQPPPPPPPSKPRQSTSRSSSLSPSSPSPHLSDTPPRETSSTPSSSSCVVVPTFSHTIQSFLSSFRPKVVSSPPEGLFSSGDGGSGSSRHGPAPNFSQGDPSLRGRTSLPCNICSKVFPTPTALKVHIRTHTGEKPFSCEFCAYRTAQKGNLATHMRTHTGEKPFICAICACRFKSGSALTGHMRSKH